MDGQTERGTRKLRVAVVFGGRSTEHAVSCVSAASVLANIDNSRFEVIPVGITPDGTWVLGSSDPSALEIQERRLPTITGGTELALPAAPASGGLITMEPGKGGQLLSEVDVVFPVLHGAYGEDGTIQGLLELAGIPYAGAGVLASAVAMDKEYTKKLLLAEGLPVADCAVLRRGADTLEPETRQRIGLPAFVKPARAGSSIGITRIDDWDRLGAAVAAAKAVDPKVLVESAVDGREIECGVLEFPDGRVDASLPAEVRLTRNGRWYDFDAKYLDGTCEFDIPAKLGDALTARLRAMAISAFHAIDCQGLARVDFFVTAADDIIVNEVNTMPGFTPTSMFPRGWEVTGLDYPALLTTLIETALARGVGLR